MTARRYQPAYRHACFQGILASLLTAALALAAVPASAQIGGGEFAARRGLLRAAMGDGLYVFAAAIDRDGRQEPGFRYLTGCLEPVGVLLMGQQGGRTDEYLLLPSPRRGGAFDPAGTALEAVGRRGAIAVRPLEDLEAVIRDLGSPSPGRIITTLPAEDGSVELIRSVLGPGELPIVNPRRALSDLRAVKSAAEIELLQVASDITRLGQIAAMRTAEPGMNEFELQAVIEYTFARYGSQRPGFSSIIGSGPNSLVLHYGENDRFMPGSDVVVMDVGAEYFGYTSDVTRTIPVDGTFSPAQRDIYEIVLAANLACARLAETAGTPYRVLQDEAQRVIGEGLARIGLIKSPAATVPGRRSSQVGLFFYHGLGHGIGLVVHDSMPADIVPGSCFTIEPGIYVRPEVLDMLGSGPEAEALRVKIAPAVARYANIGVRIEDSFAFTEDGLVCLSAGTPRTIAEIEAVMAGRNLAALDRDAELVELYRRFRIPPP